MRIYVGCKAGNMPSREVFKSDTVPTENTHGKSYLAVIGPFRTMRAAKWAASPAAIGNPHFQTVRDAERITLRIAAEQAVTKILS